MLYGVHIFVFCNYNGISIDSIVCLFAFAALLPLYEDCICPYSLSIDYGVNLLQVSSSLNSSYCFILQTETFIFTWIGNLSSTRDHDILDRMLELINVCNSILWTRTWFPISIHIKIWLGIKKAMQLFVIWLLAFSWWLKKSCRMIKQKNDRFSFLWTSLIIIVY